VESFARQPDLPLRESWRGRPAFEVGPRSFSFLEVLQAAEVRGDLGPLLARSEAAAGAECRASAEDREPDMAAVEASIDSFRYRHDLLTVEETEAWLLQRGLTVDDLGDHFLRRHWEEAQAALPGPPSPSDVGEPLSPAVWAADLLLYGDFTRLARQLAREIALAGADPGPSPVAELVEAFRHRRGLDADAFRDWREAWGLEDDRLAEFVHWQEGFTACLQAVVTPANRAALLAERYTVFRHVELEVIEFDTESVAREAFLCATADGLGLEELAQETGYPLMRRATLLGRLPPAWRQPVACATAGRVLDPLADDGTFHLCRLVCDRDATLDDPAVRAAVDEELIHRHCRTVEAAEVRWRIDPEESA
jgi:hypothetical protein